MNKIHVLNHARPTNMWMTFKTNLVLVLMLLMVTRVSGCPTSVTWEDEHQLVARAKILILGELDLVLSSVDCVSHSDLGLFVFDVVSDLINGVNFVNDGDPIWGSVIIGAIFLPATCLLALGAFVWFVEQDDGCERILFALLLPLIGPVAIAVATPAYIVYVVFVFLRKLRDPSYVSNHMDWISNYIFWDDYSRIAQPADLLKVFEAVLEANIQGIIGTNTLVSKLF